MRVFLFFVAWALFAGRASAEPASCETIGELAKTIMEARMAGVPLQDMMKDANQLSRQLLISAYEVSAYATERMQNREIVNFQNEIYLACIKQRS